MSGSTWRSTATVLLACAAGWAASGAQAQNASIIVRDADSGQLRAPTPEEARAIAGSSGLRSGAVSGRGVVTGSATPQQWVLPNGAVISETTEDMMSATVVLRGKDGKLVRQCVGSLAIANRLAQGKKVSFAKNILERHDAVR